MPHKVLTSVVAKLMHNLAHGLRVELPQDEQRRLEAVLAKHQLVDISTAAAGILEDERGRTHRAMPPVEYIVERVVRAYHQRTDAPRWQPCGKCSSGMRFTSADGWPVGAGNPAHHGLTECWCKRSFRRARERWTARHPEAA